MIKYIILVLIAGGILGYLNTNFTTVVNTTWFSDYLLDGSLLLLLFVMGVVFGMDRESISKMKQTGLKILIVPLAIAFGTVLGAVVSAFALGLNIAATTAVSMGYGWYTLAGPLATQILGTKWGALGFTTNFLRELLTIVTIPLLARLDKYAPTAAGGATTMDTTLPVIIRYSGQDVLITAFSSGFILSLIAPFTITALASLA
jgi:uncharacterized membrane protein YbjE (DUF340 family)